MMKRIRPVLFWAHLVLGLVAGAIIVITAFTGAAMAFEKQVLAWAERDRRQVNLPVGTVSAQSVDELLRRIRQSEAVGRPTGFVLSSNPAEAMIVQLGRTNSIYMNPYTGEWQRAGSAGWRAFFQCMLRWHRWLGVGPGSGAGSDGPASRVGGAGDGNPDRVVNGTSPRPQAPSAPAGLREWMSTVVGGSASVLMVLCVSGLVLWWPREWSRRMVAGIAIPGLQLRGRARDFNWHHATGFWCAPALLLMSFTGVTMAFRGVGNLVYGPPVVGVGNPSASPSESVQPAGDGKPVSYETLIAVVKREVPEWDTMTFRLGGGRSRSSAGGGELSERKLPQPVSVQVQTSGFAWVKPTQLLLDPMTGAVLRRESVGELGLRRSLRQLNRTLHTGEAGGLPGQLLAFVASLGALMLVYTGGALAWRRWRRGVAIGGNTELGLRNEPALFP